MEEDIKRYKSLYNFLIGTHNKHNIVKKIKNKIKIEKIFFEEFIKKGDK